MLWTINIESKIDNFLANSIRRTFSRSLTTRFSGSPEREGLKKSKGACSVNNGVELVEIRLSKTLPSRLSGSIRSKAILHDSVELVHLLVPLIIGQSELLGWLGLLGLRFLQRRAIGSVSP